MYRIVARSSSGRRDKCIFRPVAQAGAPTIWPYLESQIVSCFGNATDSIEEESDTENRRKVALFLISTFGRKQSRPGSMGKTQTASRIYRTSIHPPPRITRRGYTNTSDGGKCHDKNELAGRANWELATDISLTDNTFPHLAYPDSIHNKSESTTTIRTRIPSVIGKGVR